MRGLPALEFGWQVERIGAGAGPAKPRNSRGLFGTAITPSRTRAKLAVSGAADGGRGTSKTLPSPFAQNLNDWVGRSPTPL